MRRLMVLTAFLAAVIGVPASQAAVPLTGVSSGNVTWVTTVPLEAGVATGARLIGRHLYVGGTRSFSIYDVSNPLQPALLSVTPIGFVFPSEDVDSNGDILLMNDEQGALGTLRVWDVRDKTAPVLLATMPEMRDHTYTCVLRCTWAYGSRGTIVDLRNPASPRVAGRWASLPVTDGFDITEVSPGVLLTASRTMRVLDARRNPARPVVLARGTTDDDRLIHSVRWPRGGRDRFALVQGETPFSGTCNASSGAFMTWDTRGWQRTGRLRLVDAFRVTNGDPAAGNPPAGVWGCTAMWFQQHPAFRDGGLVAAGFFEHGVRFLRVGRSGEISEVGHFMPVGGSTIASYWITQDVVYSLDVQRGIDVLRYDLAAADAPPAQRRAETPSAPIRFLPAAPARNSLWCLPGVPV